MEMTKKVLGAEHPYTLTTMPTWRLLGKSRAASRKPLP